MNKYLLKSALPVMIVLLLTCCTTTIGFAQTRDSLLRVYNNETIHSFGKVYVKGSKQLKFGDLKPEFTAGITKDLYKKSKGNLIVGRLLTVTAVAALVASAVIKKDNKNGSTALTIVGIGLNLSSFSFRKKSKELIDQAIWQRNKEILFGVQ